MTQNREGFQLIKNVKRLCGFKRFSIICLVVFSASVLGLNSAEAQDVSTIINSEPQGAVISLEGEHKITATTPCRLPADISGAYRLTARMAGYESWSGEIVILPGQDNTFLFSMSPKTRFKAGLRSLIVPGWGQHYSDQKTRGIVLSVGVLGMGIGALLADSDFRNKRDDYFQAQTDLDNASSAEDIFELRDLVQKKNWLAYNAETRRNVLIGVAVGLWAYNVIDAMVFFQDRKLMIQQPLTIGAARIEATFDGQKAGLRLVATF